jgi:hypothetical protein
MASSNTGNRKAPLEDTKDMPRTVGIMWDRLGLFPDLPNMLVNPVLVLTTSIQSTMTGAQ